MEKTIKTVRPSLAESAWIWCKLGLLSFGGPTAQIALMHRLIVVERRWLNEPQFLNALSFCMLLPGPEAMQLGQRFAELQAELEKISTRESEIRILQNTYALHIKNMANPDPKIEVVQ